ncbi:MAG: hypothetical protein ABR543_02135 [Gemmatimonadaceae bacterium]
MGVTMLWPALIASSAGAQIFDVKPGSDPKLWAAVSVGYLNPGRVYDGTTETVWSFGDGPSYGGSLQFPINSGTAIGVRGSWARVPLRYDPFAGGQGTDADADIWSALATLHVGGGLGFHQVIEISAGVIGYDNFRADNGQRLAPTGGDRDFAFILGYGFGYAFSGNTHLVLLQDYAIVLHQRDGLPSDVSARTQQTTLRAGIRYGFGGRRK